MRIASKKQQRKNEIKADSKATYGFKDVVDADGLRIEFTKAELLEAEGKKDSILKLSFELSNPTADKKRLHSNQFRSEEQRRRITRCLPR